jgi:hypothetical protein
VRSGFSNFLGEIEMSRITLLLTGFVAMVIFGGEARAQLTLSGPAGSINLTDE